MANDRADKQTIELPSHSIIDNIIIVPVRNYDEVQDYFDLLTQGIAILLSEGNFSGLILDCSRLKLIDAAAFNQLVRIVSMAKLMGITAVFSGISAGIAAYIVESDYEISQIDATSNIERALAFLNAREEANIQALSVAQNPDDELTSISTDSGEFGANASE